MYSSFFPYKRWRFIEFSHQSYHISTSDKNNIYSYLWIFRVREIPNKMDKDEDDEDAHKIFQGMMRFISKSNQGSTKGNVYRRICLIRSKTFS